MLPEIEQSASLINRLDDAIAEPEISTSYRALVAAASVQLVRQHHRAIVTMVSEGLVSSAAALLRILTEAYVKALWLHECATDAELKAYRADRLQVSFGAMIAAIEALPNLDNNVLSQMKNARWKVFNSFTHSGAEAVHRQIKAGVMEPNFEPDEISDILRFSDSLALLGAGHLACITKDAQLAGKILEMTKEYSSR